MPNHNALVDLDAHELHSLVAIRIVRRRLHGRGRDAVHEAAVTDRAHGLHAHLHQAPLQAQLLHEGCHLELAHVGGDAAGLHEVLGPRLVDLAILDHNTGELKCVAIKVREHVRVGQDRGLVQVLDADLGMVELREGVGLGQINRLTSPFHVVEQVEETLQHAISGAEASAETSQRTTLEQVLHARIADESLHGRVGSHLVVIQREAALGADEVHHRAALARPQGEALEALDNNLHRVARGVLQSEGLQLLEGLVGQRRRELPWRLRACDLQGAGARGGAEQAARLSCGAGRIHGAGAADDHGAVRSELKVRAAHFHHNADAVGHDTVVVSTHLFGHLRRRDRQHEHAGQQQEDDEEKAEDDLLHHAALLLHLLEGHRGRTQLARGDLAAAVCVPLLHDVLDALRHVRVVQVLAVVCLVLHDLGDQLHPSFHLLVGDATASVNVEARFQILHELHGVHNIVFAHVARGVEVHRQKQNLDALRTIHGHDVHLLAVGRRERRADGCCSQIIQKNIVATVNRLR
mmetsp:Transcript_140598/g.449434  ORF Transcript_140598/g.449434 Transcript_140598/m.449434 type:complete len:521 (+) Transcript_140598:2427-3989(+)